MSKSTVSKLKNFKDRAENILALNLKETDIVPVHIKNFANRGVKEGKVYNQLRCGYIYSSYAYGNLNKEMASFYNLDAKKICNYINYNTILLEEINNFPSYVKKEFLNTADSVLKAAYQQALNFKNAPLESKLKPTALDLLKKQESLVSRNKMQEFRDEKLLKSLEVNLTKIAQSKEQDLIMYYRSTEIKGSKRRLKESIPSNDLITRIYSKMNSIYLKKGEVMSKEDFQAEVISLYKSGLGATKIHFKLMNHSKKSIELVLKAHRESLSTPEEKTISEVSNDKIVAEVASFAPRNKNINTTPTKKIYTAKVLRSLETEVVKKVNKIEVPVSSLPTKFRNHLKREVKTGTIFNSLRVRYMKFCYDNAVMSFEANHFYDLNSFEIDRYMQLSNSLMGRIKDLPQEVLQIFLKVVAKYPLKNAGLNKVISIKKDSKEVVFKDSIVSHTLLKELYSRLAKIYNEIYLLNGTRTKDRDQAKLSKESVKLQIVELYKAGKKIVEINKMNLGVSLTTIRKVVADQVVTEDLSVEKKFKNCQNSPLGLKGGNSQNLTFYDLESRIGVNPESYTNSYKILDTEPVNILINSENLIFELQV